MADLGFLPGVTPHPERDAGRRPAPAVQRDPRQRASTTSSTASSQNEVQPRGRRGAASPVAAMTHHVLTLADSTDAKTDARARRSPRAPAAASCSRAPSTRRRSSPSSSPAMASRPSTCTATCRRTARERNLGACLSAPETAASACSWRPTSQPAACTSTTSTSSSTSTRPPSTRRTCTARAAPLAPAPRAPWSPLVLPEQQRDVLRQRRARPRSRGRARGRVGRLARGHRARRPGRRVRQAGCRSSRRPGAPARAPTRSASALPATVRQGAEGSVALRRRPPWLRPGRMPVRRAQAGPRAPVGGRDAATTQDRATHQRSDQSALATSRSAPPAGNPRTQGRRATSNRTGKSRRSARSVRPNGTNRRSGR